MNLNESISMKNIIIVAGARPNFMKIAPVLRALKKYHNKIRFYYKPANTMTKTCPINFKDLNIKVPDYN
jgi:UDP-N-acetylglucosamine 2-epimerase